MLGTYPVIVSFHPILYSPLADAMSFIRNWREIPKPRFRTALWRTGLPTEGLSLAHVVHTSAAPIRER